MFAFLHRAAASSKSNPPIELRVAGGWVRDKLLNRPSGDIDIAIRHASGIEFAQLAKHYAQSYTETLTSSSFIGPQEYVPHCFTATCIEPNPENSRHLETAAVLLDGHTMDFVQLRTEHYSAQSDSRVPYLVSPAIPYDDAMRRDFTVNSLFYHIHNLRIEDWTGYGLRDLKNGILRTPLNASVTLKEDPLRALRAIRFACNLGFQMNRQLKNALCDPDLHHLLVRKVSRERVGHEIFHIMQSQRAVDGLSHIADCGLARAVFGQSFGDDHVHADMQLRQAIDRIKRALIIWTDAEHLFTKKKRESFEKGSRTILLFSLLTNEISHIHPMVRKALRRTKDLERDVQTVVSCGKQIQVLLERKQTPFDFPIDFKMDDHTWIGIAEVLRRAGEQLYIPVLIYCSVRMQINKLAQHLIQLGLNGHVSRLVPLVDGHILVEHLGIKGPKVGRGLRELIRLQMLHLRWDWKLNNEYDTSDQSSVVLPGKKKGEAAWMEALKNRLSCPSHAKKAVE